MCGCGHTITADTPCHGHPRHFFDAAQTVAVRADLIGNAKFLLEVRGLAPGDGNNATSAQYNSEQTNERTDGRFPRNRLDPLQ